MAVSSSVILLLSSLVCAPGREGPVVVWGWGVLDGLLMGDAVLWELVGEWVLSDLDTMSANAWQDGDRDCDGNGVCLP